MTTLLLNKMITKSPIDKNKWIENIFYTSAARVGFKHLLKNLHFNGKEKILLPAYIGITDREGSGVFDPISELKINYDFYGLEKNMKINKEDLETKILSGQFKAVLVIHYFGFAHCDIDWVSILCKKNNVLLIEDCAHTFSSTYKNIPLGNFGDFSFFSIHKFLATEDGGFLKIINKSFQLPKISDSYQRIKLETLEHLNKSKINEISKIRIRNYKYLRDKLENIDAIEILYPDLPQGIVPLNFPVIVKGNKREKLYFKLTEDKIPTIALYYRLIDVIDKDEYPASYYLSNNILNLPIHQEISPEEIDYIVERLRDFFI